MIALFLALIIVLGAGVEERGAYGAPRDVLTGREFLEMFMRGSNSHATNRRYHKYQRLSDNELIERGRSGGDGGSASGVKFVDLTSSVVVSTTTPVAETTAPPPPPPSPPHTTVDFLDAPSTTDPSPMTEESTPLSTETEPPQASQIVAVSVSSSVVRQRPAATLYVETQDEPTFSSAVQSHFSVDEGPLTIQPKDQSQDSEPSGRNVEASSHFTVERTQDGEKTSLVVRQNNGEASSHFSIRQSHSPARLVHHHHHHHLTTTESPPLVTTTTEVAVPALVQEVNRDDLIKHVGERKTSDVQETIGVPRVSQPESPGEHLGKSNKGNDKRTDLEIENDGKEEGKQEERKSFSVARNHKSYEPTYHLERKEERTSYSVGAQIARQPKHSPVGWEVPEANYEVDEAVSVMTNGRAHGIQPSHQHHHQSDPTGSQQQAKSGYVVEGRNFRKYRVEEKTPDGFIVGEYGVVSHDDGSLRGVRYTADSNINPRLIYDALVKFLSLK